MNNLELVIIDQEKFDQRQLLPADIKQQWIEALRSGKYKQGTHQLCKDEEFCCLGVLCEIQNRPKLKDLKSGAWKYDNSYHSLCFDNPLNNVLKGGGEFKGFTVNANHSLANLNDSGWSFEVIADIIEKYF